jgi:hypothetical protein
MIAGMAKPKRLAKGRVRSEPGVMNRLEAAYGAYLELRKRAGEIEWYAFDAIKLRLAEKTFYTPDFVVMLTDATIEIHEVKGHWEDDARVKIKVAASLYPLRFVGITREKGAWQREEF